LRQLVEQIPCVVWVTDRDLRITSAIGQPDAWETAGWDRGRAVGARLQQILGTEDARDPVLELHAAALQGSSGAVHYHLGPRWYEVHLEPLRDDAQTIIGCIGAALDVTERELAREEVARSEARLEEAQRIAHVGNWEWEVAQDRVRWSDELHDIYGLEVGHFAGTYDAFLERVLPEDREHTRAVVFDAFRNAKPFEYDHRIVRPDRSVRMLHTRGAVMTDDHGRVVRMAGACWDITERWQAQREADRSFSILQATLESTADALLVIDRKGAVVTFNRRLLDLWKLTPRDVEGKTFDALLARVHDQLANGDECLQRVRELESRPDAESFDALQFLDGRVFERYSRPQRVGDDIVGRVWSYRDVTEREHLLRSALFLADAGRLLATLDEDRALEAVGRLSLTYLGDACAIDLFTAGAPRRIVALSRDSTQSIAAELPRAAIRGNPMVYTVASRSCIAVPIMARGETIGVLSFAAPDGRTYVERDLSLATELARRIELSLQNARLYHGASEALAARDEFLGIAAHEIRGPLTALQLAAQGLPAARGDTTRHLLSIIEREARRLASFVDEMFDVARVRSGQLSFTFAPVDLVEVTREVTERMAVDITRSGSSLSLTAPASMVGTWDRTRLVQVVTNLLANAVKFGLGKPIAIEIDHDDTHARWRVSDQGIGIPEDAQERIFRPFERAVSTRHYGGLGLGLFIVRSIIDALDGTIRLDSAPGAGSKFTVVLPLRRAP
jgi:PAS domain S-box-containing protein